MSQLSGQLINLMSEWMSDWVSETGWINEGVNDFNDQWINSRLCKQINEWKN